MYAIIKTGGKQYRVKQGDVIDVELLKVDGNAVDFNEVLLLNTGTEVKIGAPVLTECTVTGELLGQVKGPKVVAFKYRRRKSSRRKVGHRQKYSRVKITSITAA